MAKPLMHNAPPLVLFEDDHLLAVHKPSGINTHKPDRYAQDGIHEWLQKQRPAWRKLAILHRLDKETSGVMLFGRTPAANKSLTAQFESGTVRKTYRFLTTGTDACAPRTVSTPIEGKTAQTIFRAVERVGGLWMMEAQPATGRTHQVRLHAAEAGFPIAGDREHGSTSGQLPRLMLHAATLAFRSPGSEEWMEIEAPLPRSFGNPDPLLCAEEMRQLLFHLDETNCHRLVSGAADGFPEVIVDRFGEAVLVQYPAARRPLPDWIEPLSRRFTLFRQDTTPGARSRPQSSVAGPQSFPCREHGLQFVIRMDQGFSPGLFLDQRENRRRLRSLAAGKEVLNCFAYTCSLSVASAAGGGTTTSVDVSKSYLDWGRENFRANQINPEGHDFIYGDVFDWLKRFGKRGRQWDIVLLDPPSFGTTKKGKVFRAAKDYSDLVRQAVPLVRRGGTLFCSTNLRSLAAESFVTNLERAVRDAKREIRSMEFETQPFDVRVADGEKPYLKTVWLVLD